jgi:tetratricopeptide (TPR) repeat protein
VAFDRNGTLRNAEKLLRSGKVDAAIAEYLRVIEDQPTDWATTNTLGDLYVRAGQIDKALEQYLKVAESLREEGQLVKAAALYKKILKLKPDDERTLMQAADVFASQGRFPDARAYLNTVLEKRLAARDARGAAMARVRIGGIDPNDYAARMDGARARLEINDINGAVTELTAIAGELSEGSRFDEAIAALQLAAGADPENEGVRTQLFELYISSDEFGRAAELASTAAQFASLAESLELRERHDEAVRMLERAVELDADDTALRVRAAKALMARGNVDAASDLLTAEAAGDDPDLMVTAVEVQLRSGRLDEGIMLARKLIEQDPTRREDVAALGANVAPHAPEAGFALVELSAEVAVANNDWAAAAAALQQFAERAPTFIPGVMRLVEICVDGGLEMMFSAQAQLADAYIATGAVAEARFIAEDLVAREPWERTNIERFRRTLEMLGEPDPDGVIAERLSGESPFMSTDLLGFDAAEEETAAHPDGLSPELLAMLDEAEGPSDFQAAPRQVESPSGPVVSVAGLDDLTLPGAEHLELHESNVVDTVAELTIGDVDVEEPERAAAPPKRRSHFDLSTNAIDLDSILGDIDEASVVEPEAPAPVPMPSTKKSNPEADQESVEVDLSIDLDGINEDRKNVKAPVPFTGPKAAPEPEPESPQDENDIDSVFAQLRSEASRRSTGDGAEEQMKQGLALRAAGKLDKALQAFEIASRSPRHRFQASVYAGRIYRERNQMAKAIEWFERATQAPAPTTDDGFELLYELADALEATGETARALAVCLEILADAGDFRDVKERVSRLSKVQARG